jgi:hypothetical protein
MGKALHSDVQDGALNIIKNNSTRMCLCSAQPTTANEATVTFELADIIMAPGDYTVGPGDVSGRKVVAAAKSAVPVDASGSGNHIAHVDITGTRLLGVTTCPAVAVTLGGTVDIGSHKLEVANPT